MFNSLSRGEPSKCSEVVTLLLQKGRLQYVSFIPGVLKGQQNVTSS